MRRDSKGKFTKETSPEKQPENKLLDFVWEKRLELRAEGIKLKAEGEKLSAEGNKLHVEGANLRIVGEKLYAEGWKLRAEGNKLFAEGEKLSAEGNKLRAEGDLLWAEAILAAYGNVKLQWKNWNDKYQSSECHLDNGLVFGFKE